MAVPWSLFPRELSVGQVLSLSLLWRGHDCRTWAVVCASSPQGQRADFSIPIFFMWLCSLQWPVLSRNIMVCSWHDSKRWVSRLTASCSSCSWLFHPGVYCLRLPRGIDFLAATRIASVMSEVSLLRWCYSRLIFLQFSSANFLKTSQLAFLKFQLGLW